MPVEECSAWVEKIDSLKDYWTKRSSVQYTLGLASYMDCGLETRDYYNPNKLSNNNQILLSAFSGLYKKLIAFLSRELKTNVKLHADAAHPGFHIYPPSLAWTDQTFNLSAVHKDIQFKDVFPNERCTKENLFSFTLSLRLPEMNSGLNIWPNGKNKEMEFLTYKEGYIAMHSGLTTHQAVMGSCLNRPRITLQGHGFTKEGQTLLYW